MSRTHPQRRALDALDRQAAPAKLAHVVFRSPSKDRLRDWYATVLGARVVFATGSSAS